MKYITIMVVLILLIGCTNPTVIYRNITINRTINNTIYRNNTEYINITTVLPCNTSCPELEACPDGNYKKSYVLSLIQQVKRLEKNQDKYWNNSECQDDLNRTEVELEECEYEICKEWNSSWC